MPSVTRRTRRSSGRARCRGTRRRCCTVRSGSAVLVLHRVERAPGRQDRTSVRPLDRVLRLHSVFEVGFESGKMIGRSLWRHISLTISSVKMPGVAELPISIVGFAFVIVSRSVICERSLTL